MKVLEVAGLKKAYGGVHALRGIDFCVDAGEIVALIGPNGAGKSTCFDILGGQVAPDAGHVALEGASLARLAPQEIWRKGVGRTFQIAATFGSMSVRENVQLALLSHQRRAWELTSLAACACLREADALLARAGIAAQAERTCSVLAYGDLKRVEFALALAHRPKLLLMDEPTAGMAPHERGELMGLAAGLARDDGIAVLFTEHDMDVVFAHADRVLVLAQGELIAAGTPDEVRANARVQRAYLGVDHD
jgi:branched-chain amino acid transport system ATP-binding protein